MGRTAYDIVVTNPEHRCRGVAAAQLDGATADHSAIPLVDDGATHHVRVVLGTVGGLGSNAMRPDWRGTAARV